jgi:hypothetical protein
MTIEDLRLAIADCYQLDVFMPPITGRYSRTFEEASIRKFSVNDLEEYVIDRMERSGSRSPHISEVCKYVEAYRDMRMGMSKTASPKAKKCLRISKDVACDFLEVLRAMK